MTDICDNNDDCSLAAESIAADECDRLIRDERTNSGLHLEAGETSNGSRGQLIGKLFSYLGSNSSHRSSSPATSFVSTLKLSKQQDKVDDTIRNYLTDHSRGESRLGNAKVRFHIGCDETDHRRSFASHRFIVWRKLRKLLISFSICLLSLTIFIYLLGELIILTERRAPVDQEIIIDHYQLDASKRLRWIVSSSKCHIPQLEAWHKSIDEYVERKLALNCSSIAAENGINRTSLSYVKGNRLHLIDEALKKGDCCLREITRQINDDDKVVLNGSCLAINKTELRAPFELVQVECPSQNYTNIHSFVVHHLEEDKSTRKLAEKRLNEEEYFNVVMLGMDTISRLNGYRQLNRTLNLLRSKYKTLEFVGYNKVGENTFPNLIPLLTGLRAEQLAKARCWLPSNYTDESEKGDDYLDNCKYLWNYYRDFGYLTYFSEDWPKASTFNYLKPGFKHEPTSFYGRPATIARDNLLLPPVGMGCASCLLDRPLVEVDLNSLKTFLQEYHKRPHFAFHWVNCPQHDDLNGASRVDQIVRRFFIDIHKITQNERTFVVFFSDHGYRWNDFVSTRIGHYESSLPMLTIAPPRRFIEKHPVLYKNLISHMRTLITPFDLFKTLVEIRNLGEKPGNLGLFGLPIKNKRESSTALPVVGVTTSKQPLGSSSTTPDPARETIQKAPKTSLAPTAASVIVQQPVLDGLNYKQSFNSLSLLARHNSTQLDRSCSEAGIPDNYCVCHEFDQIDSSRTDVLGAAYYLVYVHLYGRLQNHDKLCHLLQLDKVHDAQLFDFKRMKPGKNSSGRKKRASPSEAVEPETSGSDTTLPPVESTLKPTAEPAPIQTPTQITTMKARSTTSTPTTIPGTPTTRASMSTAAPTPDGSVVDEHNYLPNREYNIRVSTKPGGGLFQEVVRFYGNDSQLCDEAIEKVKLIIEDPAKTHGEKNLNVLAANFFCKFSIHSDSISRLNLYKDQSKCVKSNIELKKICYCKT